MGDVKVSVVIPVYNAERYVQQCLQSCISQTLREIEIICVCDGGSKDNSSQIIHSIADKDNRVVVIDNPHQNPGQARNDGVKIAKGKYLLFLDSDDWLEPNALELAFAKAEAESSDVLFYNLYNYYEDTGLKNKINNIAPYYPKYKDKSFSPVDAADIIYETNALPLKMYNRKFWIENDIHYSEHNLQEDIYPYVKSLLCAKIVRRCRRGSPPRCGRTRHLLPLPPSFRSPCRWSSSAN